MNASHKNSPKIIQRFKTGNPIEFVRRRASIWPVNPVISRSNQKCIALTSHVCQRSTRNYLPSWSCGGIPGDLQRMSCCEIKVTHKSIKNRSNPYQEKNQWQPHAPGRGSAWWPAPAWTTSWTWISPASQNKQESSGVRSPITAPLLSKRSPCHDVLSMWSHVWNCRVYTGNRYTWISFRPCSCPSQVCTITWDTVSRQCFNMFQ